MSRELIAVIDQIGREKGIDKAKVIGAVEAALQTAAKKRFGQSENIQVQIDQKTGEISVKFIKPVFADDDVTVTALEAKDGYDVEARNQHGDTLMVGTAHMRPA